jgi:hypothetical protein
MSVKLTQPVPAFRIDDAVLERLWRALETKCAEAGPPAGTLSVWETVRVAGRRAPEKHEHEYQSIDELRRASSGPGLLRNYLLRVSSPWGGDHRRVTFHASGGGRAAWVEVNAADAEWCREVVDAVLDLLRPHTVRYAIVHRGEAPYTAIGVVTLVTVVSIVGFQQHPWFVFLALALQMSFVALILGRERILPAADIRVRRRAAGVATLESGQAAGGQPRDRHPGPHGREPPDRAGGEPVRKGPAGIVALSDHRKLKRSEGGDTTSR